MRPCAWRALASAFFVCLAWTTGWAHPSEAEKIALLTQRIQAEPANQRNYMERGAAYTHDGQFDLALADFRKAEQTGDPVRVAYELAVLYDRTGELQTARRYADAFLHRFPDSAAALQLQARLLAKLGEREQAIANYEKLLSLPAAPNPGTYLALAALVREHHGEGGVAASLAVLDRGIGRLGVIPQLQQPAIDLETQRGAFANAIERLDRLEPMLGSSPEWKVQKVEMLLKVDRADEAGALLTGAAKQLESLRATPARHKLKARIEQLSQRVKVDHS
jgi:tetratricopeptide (TPR) repeat protein